MDKRIEALMDDIGIEGPGREQTKQFAINFLAESGELSEGVLDMMLISFNRGYKQALGLK